MSQAEALALWRRYKATGDARLRDRLIMTYAPLVKYIVYRKIREVPAHQEAEDYISHGLEALIMSIDRYDPSKGATLEQFLWTRIHGAVLDELRRQDWAPRSVRRFDRQAIAAARSFRAIHHREPTDEELADALAVTVDDLRGHRARPHPRRRRLAALRRVRGGETTRASSGSRPCSPATRAPGPSTPRCSATPSAPSARRSTRSLRASRRWPFSCTSST